LKLQIKYIVFGGRYTHFGNQTPTPARSSKLRFYPLLSGLWKKFATVNRKTCRR